MSSRQVCLYRVALSISALALLACGGDGKSADADAQVQQDVAPTGLLLTVAVQGPGQVTDDSAALHCPPSCERRDDPGTSVTLHATPDLGAWVAEWTGDCAGAGSDADAVVVLDADRSCGVRFEQLPVGTLQADITVSREVVREFASEAAAGDSRVQLFAGTGPEVDAWSWRVIHSETGVVRHSSTEENPTFDFEAGDRGAYDVALTITSGQESSRFRHRRLITVVLPRVPAGRTVHYADLTQGSYFQEGMIDGQVVAPGDLVVVSGSMSGSWAFFNFIGTPEAPIHVVNDGLVENVDSSWLLHLINCQYLIIDGLGDDAHAHGIYLANNTTDGSQGIFVRNYTQGNNQSTGSTGIEIYGVHVAAAPGTGVAVRTKGDAEFQRDNFRFDDFRLHHMRVQNVGDEGFYIGYTRDWVGSGETHPAFQLHNARIYRNEIDSTGWDGLQVCNSVDVELHDNVVTNAAVDREQYQASSLQWNSGNSGAVYNNVFAGGVSSDLQVGCTGGDSYFFSNVFEGENGLYIHGGLSDGPAYYLFANTILADDNEAIRVNIAGGSDNCTGSAGSVASLSAVLALDNLALLSASTDFFAVVAGDPATLTQTVSSNLVRDSADVADLCLADPAATDVSITCTTSAATDGSGTDLSDVPELDLSALPMGLVTDLTGRVIELPGNYGAYQAVSP